MTASPDTVAGTVNGFTLSVGGGTGTLGPSGSSFSGGIMTFLDDSNSSANQGFYLTGATFLGSLDFIADFRIRVLQNQQGASGGGAAAAKVMSFKSGNQRGLHMDTGF